MLYHIQSEQLQDRRGGPGYGGESEFIGLRDIRAFLGRHLFTIIMCVALSMLAGGIYVVTAQPLYTSRAQLVIDPESTRAFREQAGDGYSSLDNAKVESQIEFLRSERIATSVIEKLGLIEDPDFKGVGSLLPAIGKGDDTPDASRPSNFVQLRNAIADFSRNLYVRRVGQSYLIDVAFTSPDPDKAAAIANATVNAYIADQLEAKAQAARRGGEWLEERIAELRKQLNAAARAAQEFRAQNNIIDVGNRGLLDDQQMTELNTQLVLARARTAETRARLERIQEILKSDIPDAAVVEVLGSQLISNLREKYLTASNKLADLKSRYTPDHPAVMNLTAEMNETRRAMEDELRRIAEVYKSDAEVARLREDQLKTELEKGIRHAATTREAQITAAELDAVAQSYRKMYESYLQTLAEAVQRESFPVSDARVISPAAKPLGKSAPRSKLVMALAGLVGGILGMSIAVVRQALDRSLRSPRQLRRNLSIECLGLLPRVTGGRWANLLFPWRGLGAGTARTRYRLDVEKFPHSTFASTMRNVKTSIDIARHLQSLECVAITSLVPGEGKSTVALNIAKLFAISGTRTLLVDANIHASRGLRFASDAKEGLLDVLRGTASLEEARVRDEKIPLDILAPGGRGIGPNLSSLLGSDAMKQFLDAARRDYEFVLIDLPSMKVAPDARAISPFVDALVVVAQSGATPVDVLGEALQELQSARAGILGVVVNKAETRRLTKHGNLATSYYS
jgi:succinoglycan biosynthesis transport protein ExoP